MLRHLLVEMRRRPQRTICECRLFGYLSSGPQRKKHVGMKVEKVRTALKYKTVTHSLRENEGQTLSEERN